MVKKVLKDSCFYIPILILSINILAGLYYIFLNVFTKIVNISDLKLHSTWLFFLAKYGFNGLVPNFWNGFKVFTLYPLGWHFFSLPWYYIIGDPFHTAFFSVIQTLLLGFVFIFYLGKLQKISKIKRLALFLFFFANPQIIDYMKIGRYPELLAWVFFIAFFTIIFWYKDHKIDKKFLFIIPAYSAVILTHTYPAIIVSSLMLCLFLIKEGKERIMIVLSGLLTLIVTSFWWIPFVQTIMSRPYSYDASSELLDLESLISYNTFFLLLFLFMFYFYYKNNRKRKELLFFSPLIILDFIVLTRLVTLIPTLKDIYITPYNVFFLFLALFLFFKTDIRSYPMVIKKYMPIILILISSFYLIVLFFHMPNFTPSTDEIRDEILSLLPYVEDRYILIPYQNLETLSSRGKGSSLILNYAAIYYNLSTPFGTGPHPNMVPDDILDAYQKIYGCLWLGPPCDTTKLERINCNTILSVIKEQNVKSLLSADKGCSLLENCGFEEKIRKKRACLYFYNK